jgi:hypothetical protein
MIIFSQRFFRRACSCAICLCAIVALLGGCNDNRAVTISATSLEKNGSETHEVGSVGTMTSDLAGALVSVGGTTGALIPAKITAIDDSQVTLEVAYPEHQSQQIRLKVGESKDVFFGDRSDGVRLRFTEAK